jgi:hypothetical protein
MPRYTRFVAALRPSKPSMTIIGGLTPTPLNYKSAHSNAFVDSLGKNAKPMENVFPEFVIPI